MSNQPRDPVAAFAEGVKVFGYDLPKDVYRRITKTGKHSPKPKPKNTKQPYTSVSGTQLENFSAEEIKEFENSPVTKKIVEKKKSQKEKHANKPYKKKKVYSNTTRKAKYKD